MVAVESDNFVIYCMTEVWEGVQYGKLQFPQWQSVSLNLQPKSDQILVPALLSISLASLHRDSSHPSLSLTDHVSWSDP